MSKDRFWQQWELHFIGLHHINLLKLKDCCDWFDLVVARYGLSVRYHARGHGAGITILLRVTVNLWVTATQPSNHGTPKSQHPPLGKTLAPYNQ